MINKQGMQGLKSLLQMVFRRHCFELCVGYKNELVQQHSFDVTFIELGKTIKGSILSADQQIYFGQDQISM